MSYGATGITTATDALGRERVFSYNALGVLTEARNGAGQTTSAKTYDTGFHQRTITDGAANTTLLNWSEDGANLG